MIWLQTALTFLIRKDRNLLSKYINEAKGLCTEFELSTDVQSAEKIPAKY